VSDDEVEDDEFWEAIDKSTPGIDVNLDVDDDDEGIEFEKIDEDDDDEFENIDEEDESFGMESEDESFKESMATTGQTGLEGSDFEDTMDMGSDSEILFADELSESDKEEDEPKSKKKPKKSIAKMNNLASKLGYKGDYFNSNAMDDFATADEFAALIDRQDSDSESNRGIVSKKIQSDLAEPINKPGPTKNSSNKRKKGADHKKSKSKKAKK
jgi:hypothetical protein